MAPDWNYKNHPADRSLKEDLSIDTTFDPSYISWDTPFKAFLGGLSGALGSTANFPQPNLGGAYPETGLGLMKSRV
jgi:hypothetical protein